MEDSLLAVVIRDLKIVKVRSHFFSYFQYFLAEETSFSLPIIDFQLIIPMWHESKLLYNTYRYIVIILSF